MIRLQELELVFGQTDARTHGRTNGWTHRRDVGNSILDRRKSRFPFRTFFCIRLNFRSVEGQTKPNSYDHRCRWVFFQGGGKIDPLECRNFFSGGKVGGPGGK